MNIQEIKDAIVVKEFKNFSENRTMFIAELTLSRSAFVTEELLETGPPDTIARIKKDLVESILRDLYEDRRRVMHIALLDAFASLKTSPFQDPKTMFEIRDKLIDAAGRSVPSETTNQ